MVITTGVMCVDIRKYFLPYGMEAGDEKPTRHGIALRLEEWASLLRLIPVIEQAFPTLAATTPCYDGHDHLTQLDYLACTVCYPFGVNDYINVTE